MGTLFLLLVTTLLGGGIAGLTHNPIWMGALLGFLVGLIVRFGGDVTDLFD